MTPWCAVSRSLCGCRHSKCGMPKRDSVQQSEVKIEAVLDIYSKRDWTTKVLCSIAIPASNSLKPQPPDLLHVVLRHAVGLGDPGCQVECDVVSLRIAIVGGEVKFSNFKACSAVDAQV